MVPETDDGLPSMALAEAKTSGFVPPIKHSPEKDFNKLKVGDRVQLEVEDTYKFVKREAQGILANIIRKDGVAYEGRILWDNDTSSVVELTSLKKVLVPIKRDNTTT